MEYVPKKATTWKWCKNRDVNLCLSFGGSVRHHLRQSILNLSKATQYMQHHPCPIPMPNRNLVARKIMGKLVLEANHQVDRSVATFSRAEYFNVKTSDC